VSTEHDLADGRLLLVGGAASQLGFYRETGGNINWRDAAAFTSDHDGLMVLLSGLASVVLTGLALVVGGVVLGGFFYQLVGRFVQSVADMLSPSKLSHTAARLTPVIAQLSPSHPRYTRIPSEDDLEAGSDCGSSSDGSGDETVDEKTPFISLPRPTIPTLYNAIVPILLTICLTILLVIRPSKPYRRISTTLPISMLAMFEPLPDACTARGSLVNNPFPHPQLITNVAWRRSDDYDKGWAPSSTGRLSPLAEMYRERQVDWITDQPPRGFFRWDKSRFDKGYFGWLTPNSSTIDACAGVAEEDVYYNPVSDPLKISNLDMEVLPSLRDAMTKITIKHVVVIMLEGVREGVWPLQKGSHFYHMLTKKAYTEDVRKLVDERLSRLSPNIERITGVPMGFLETPYAESKWTDSATPGYGGVNVQGAYTAATMTSKAFQSVHCGTPPMSVDGFEEADLDDYQPCLPQILDLFNQVTERANPTDSTDYRNRPWRTAIFESTSEQYDRLDVFDKRIGYHKRFARREIEQDERFNASLPLYQKNNYFSYPEPTIVPHLDIYLDDLKEKNERMFLTHFTSTTHHRWDVPKDYPFVDYMPHDGGKGWGEHINKYMNTIRYTDEWLGTLMQMLETKGMAKETLVVFASDHGLSFLEDNGKEGTYENDHVSNFRIGLTFRHPELPQVQYQANMTTLSVLPTILDMLISSDSLSKEHKHIASDLVHDYEGQSLIRPYKPRDGERRAWAITVVNPGARRLGVTSADAPWRLSLPLSEDAEYRVTDVEGDPLESQAITSWTPEGLLQAVQEKMGDEAVAWVAEAIPTGRWWVKEKMRLWRYKAV
jgi:hypothetical protein